MLNCCFSGVKDVISFHLRHRTKKNKTQINKMLAHFQLARDHLIYCITGACAVLRLASAAVNQNQARLKYRLQFLTSEFPIFV